MIITALSKGFVVTAGLIIAIGAQNAFVIRQGLKKHHLFLTAITCFICDALLMMVGVFGFGIILETLPAFETFLRWGGALFLLLYGLKSFASVFQPNVLVAELDQKNTTIWGTLLPLLGFTFLNPHTYIDTFLLLGNVSAQCTSEERPLFIIGALSASLLWFFSLTYGASLLRPYFKKPRTWQILHMVMGCMMLIIAYTLIPMDQ